MNIPKIRGINRLEVWITDLAKLGFKRYCQKHKTTMKDMTDFLIRQHLQKHAPELLEMEHS